MESFRAMGRARGGYSMTGGGGTSSVTLDDSSGNHSNLSSNHVTGLIVRAKNFPVQFERERQSFLDNKTLAIVLDIPWKNFATTRSN